MARYKIAIVTALILSNGACITQRRSFQSNSALPSAAKPSAQLNLNTATVDELEKLPGIGKVMAERIVEHRRRYGSFRRIEHIMMVRGISERKFLEMRNHIRVE